MDRGAGHDVTGMDQGPSRALITVIAIAAGALVANLYYAQPLISSIGPELGISPDVAGSIVSVTQVGYGIGLFFLVSLADLVENKRLVLTTLSLTTLGLVGMALSGSAVPFFISAFVIGVCSTGAQVLIPFIAHLIPPERRGRTVGNVMAGVLTGIMLARPASLFIASAFGWRAVFWFSAVLMAGIGFSIARMMPRHKPAPGMHYGQILASMGGLVRSMPQLRWRSIYQMLLFSAFNLFWTAVPLVLADRFGLSQQGIGLFALAGAGGALAAPIVGRLADRGLGVIVTAMAMLGLAVCFLASGYAAAAGALVVMAVLGVLIDAAVQGNQVVSQRIIFATSGESRGRVNAIYMTTSFIGGAIGSILGTVTYHGGGWTATAGTGAAMGLIALALFMVERRGRLAG